MPQLIMSQELETPNAGSSAEPTIPVESTQPDVDKGNIETLDSIAKLADKRTDESVPLRKYMDEKKAHKETEARAKELEAELEAIRNQPKSKETAYDVKALSDKHGIDEEVLSDILNASYTMTKQKVREELESELSPKLAKLDAIENDKKAQDFNTKFENMVAETLNELPEYAGIIDKDDLKDWVLSGKYSKLSMAQLVEQKYSKFVTGKKTLESSNPSREQTTVDINNLTEADWARMDSDPSLRKQYNDNFEDRMKLLLK